jgi:hypothetical protein
MRFRVTTVEATFTPEGWPVPSSVLWDGEVWTVIEIGRRWRQADGVHVLVRVTGGKVFELHTNGSSWRAAIIADPPGRV